jgi:hypothetical protein
MTTITASTSVVLVPTSTGSGPYIVYFPNISTSGRLITVRDNDGYASTGNAVILSTLGGTTFAGITGSLEINQPFGFITLNSQLNGSYGVLNTFAFPAGQASANVSNINTQNIYVASTIQIRDQANNSTTSIYVSSSRIVFDNTFVGDITIEELQSTVNGLGSIGYLSSLYVESYYPSWVAVGNSSNGLPTGTIQYSRDAQVWSNALTGGFNSYGVGATYGKQTYVAVGNNNGSNLGNHQWSVDGSNWFNSVSPVIGTNQLRTAVSYGNGLFHSVGYDGTLGGGNTVMWSSDGKTWNPSIASPFGSGSSSPVPYGTGIAYGIGIWVASGVQYGFPPARSLIWSTDGSNWNTPTGAAWSGQEVYDVAWNGSKFIATCTNGSNVNASNVCASTDGKNWTSAGITNGNFNNGARYVAGNGLQWIITTNNPGRSLVYSLDNGSNWLSNANISGCNLSMYKPYWDGTKWWIGVQTATSESLYYSTDAQTWQPTPVSSQFRNGGYARGIASADGYSNINLLLNSTVIGLQTSFTTSNLRVYSDNIALGNFAGQTSQQSSAIAIGYYAGNSNQKITAVAIGREAGVNNQGVASVAIGFAAGYNNQHNNTTVLNATGSILNTTQTNSFYVAPIRTLASPPTPEILYYNTTTKEITAAPITTTISTINSATINASTITVSSLFVNVATVSTIYEEYTYISSQYSKFISTGSLIAGSIELNSDNVALGNFAGETSQGPEAIAIGLSAGSSNQGIRAISIGYFAGQTNQSSDAIAIGNAAGLNTQGSAIAIGNDAGGYIQNNNAIAIGPASGYSNQYQNAIAIGNLAGYDTQKQNAIAIGYRAGFINQSTNTIVLNATGSALNTIQDNSFYVAPIRALGSSEAGTQAMFYNNTTKEITAAQGINISTISTYSMTVYGPNTFTSQGSTILQGPVLANTLNVNTISSGNINIANFSPVSILVSSISTYSMAVYGPTGSLRITNNGTAGQPSLRWPTGDAADDTGFYHPGDGIIAASANGVERFRVNTSGISVDGDIYGGGARINGNTIDTFIGHSNLANFGTSYGFKQNASGFTKINCVPAGDITFSQGGSNMGYFEASTSNLNVYGSVIADNAKMGAISGTIASFGYSSYANTTNAALYQDSAGNTYLNSKGGQALTFRTGNNEMGYFDAANSNFYVKGNITQDVGGITIPPFFRFLPLAWLYNGQAAGNSLCFPIYYTGTSIVNSPLAVSDIEDNIQLGPRVKVHIYADGSGGGTEWIYENSSYTDFLFLNVVSGNQMNSYKAYFY